MKKSKAVSASRMAGSSSCPPVTETDEVAAVKHITTRSSYSQTNVYNGLNTRVSKTVGALTRTYHRAGPMPTDPVLSDGANFYTPGISVSDGAETRFQHGGLKSFEAQSDSSEAIQSERQYDAFGNLLSTSGTRVGELGYGGAFGYQEDEGSGLRLLGHRYYDSSTGRFLTRDPIKHGRNWYVYCENDPVNAVDPDGLEWRKPNEQERKKLLDAITFIKASGYGKKAAILLDLLERGRLVVSNGPYRGKVRDLEGFYSFGIIINIEESQKGYKGAPHLELIALAGALIHELTHWLQGFSNVVKDESEAHGAEYHFYITVYHQRGRDKRFMPVLGKANQTATDFIDLYAPKGNIPIVIRRPIHMPKRR